MEKFNPESFANVRKLYNDAVSDWGRESWNVVDKRGEITLAINRAFEFVRSNFEPPYQLNEAIEKFVKLSYGFLDVQAEVNYFHEAEKVAFQKLCDNPMLIWEYFDASKDKKKFLEHKDYEIGLNMKKNLLNISKSVLGYYSEIQNVGVQELIDMPEDKRKELATTMSRSIRKQARKKDTDIDKQSLIKALICNFEQLRRMGYIDAHIRDYNDAMVANNMLYMRTSDEELKEMFTEAKLSELSYVELCALQSFYVNRITKLQEEIGIGLFALAKFNIANRDAIAALTYDDIKNVWLEYSVFKDIMAKDAFDIIANEGTAVNENGSVRKFTIDQTYDRVFKESETPLSLCFTKTKEEIKEDATIFCETIGINQENNYRLKDCAINEILSSDEIRSYNWGIMPDRINTPEKLAKGLISDKVLIGIDFPNLSLPLRLHCKTSDVIDILKFLKEDEIPVYSCPEDFIQFGEVIRSKLILPISATQKKLLKAEKQNDLKQRKFKSHLVAMRYENPVKRIYKAHGIKKECPDYYSFETRTLRKTASVDMNCER